MFQIPPQEAYLISKPEHQSYLTGFSGEGFVILTQKETFLATDQRYWLIAKKKKQKGVKLFEISEGWQDRLQKLLSNFSSISFEDTSLTVASLAQWKKILPQKSWKKLGNILIDQRMIKTSEELDKLRKAAQIGDRVLKGALKECLPGVTELYLANRLRQLSYEYADGVSFDPIVAFGQNAAIPHHHSGNTKLRNNDAILIDQGVSYRGYMSDMTRCFFVGKGLPEVRQMYDLLLQVQLSAVQMIRPGVKISDLDLAVRAFLGKASRYFTHSLGHGVGLEIHESPSISRNSSQVLEKGMVITIEPGLYKPGVGGVRIEDTVIITDSGCEVITKSSKIAEL